MATKIFNPFAVQYAKTIPMNPNLSGIPTAYNPYESVVKNEALKKTLENAVRYIFNPAERQAYRRVTEPARIQEQQDISKTMTSLADRGLADSSVAQSVIPFTKAITQDQINQATDQIRVNYAQARNAEITKRLLDEINFIKLLQNTLVNQREYPTAVTSSPTYQNSPIFTTQLQ